MTHFLKLAILKTLMQTLTLDGWILIGYVWYSRTRLGNVLTHSACPHCATYQELIYIVSYCSVMGLSLEG